MTKFSCLLRAGIPLAFAALLAPAAFAVTTFDGTYQIDATTQEGDCVRSTGGTVTVSNGLITGSSDSSVTALGRIGEDGAVSFSLHRGADIAHISGRLKGGRGQGSWSAPMDLCGGTWRAQKVR